MSNMLALRQSQEVYRESLLKTISNPLEAPYMLPCSPLRGIYTLLHLKQVNLKYKFFLVSLSPRRVYFKSINLFCICVYIHACAATCVHVCTCI